MYSRLGVPVKGLGAVEDQVGLRARPGSGPGTPGRSCTPTRVTSCPRSRSASAIWYSISGSSSFQAATSRCHLARVVRVVPAVVGGVENDGDAHNV